jgi:hypothetical protein
MSKFHVSKSQIKNTKLEWEIVQFLNFFLKFVHMSSIVGIFRGKKTVMP